MEKEICCLCYRWRQSKSVTFGDPNMKIKKIKRIDVKVSEPDTTVKILDRKLKLDIGHVSVVDEGCIEKNGEECLQR